MLMLKFLMSKIQFLSPANYSRLSTFADENQNKIQTKVNPKWTIDTNSYKLKNKEKISQLGKGFLEYKSTKPKRIKL